MKIKQPILLVVLTLVVGLVGTVHAFSNEPEDFRGIKWGTNIDKYTDLHFVGVSDSWTRYQRNNENLKIGEATLQEIEYYFYQNKFHSVRVRFFGEQNLLDLKKTLSKDYGKGIKNVKGYSVEYQWHGPKVDTKIEYDNISKKGVLVYTYLPISAEIAKDQKKPAIEDEGQPLK
jgi:hypothetical protein